MIICPIQCIIGYFYRYTGVIMTAFVLQGHIYTTDQQIKRQTVPQDPVILKHSNTIFPHDISTVAYETLI